MQVQVHPVHFEDFSGAQFERLSSAYLLRRPNYSSVDWYGQLGKDSGRDIICEDVGGAVNTYQCVNYRKLSYRKAETDIHTLAKGARSKRARFCLIAGGTVSGPLKDKIRASASKAGFAGSQVWSGAEFEERLRRDTPDLLFRFTRGVEFPETPSDLAAFAADASGQSDKSIVAALTVAFDRPAYKTPFHMESSLPRFRKAIAETIDTLNTGRTPSGKVLPSKSDIADKSVQKAIDRLVERLVSLRAAFEQMLRQKEIQHCQCGNEDCPVYTMTDAAVNEMDRRRRELLNEVHRLNPEFDASFYESY
jgi:hypothetical protein